MPVVCSKPCQISKMMRHLENPGIVRIICLGIFRHVQAYFTMKHIQALLRHIELYSDIFRTLCKHCIYNHTIFRILTYLNQNASEPEASSKVCQTCKMIMHIQNPDIVGTVYSSIFGDIDAYSVTLIGMQLQGRVEVSPVLFKKSKKVSWFWKKGPYCVHLWVEKNFKVFPSKAFFSCVFDKTLIKVS